MAALDAERREATLADGSHAGVRPLPDRDRRGARPPRIPGGQDALLLRTLDDSERDPARAVAGSRVVVIGGGFIGVEVAGSLAARGVRVTVVELAGALWGGASGTRSAPGRRSAWPAAGVGLRLGAACEAVTSPGCAWSGEQLDADLVGRRRGCHAAGGAGRTGRPGG